MMLVSRDLAIANCFRAPLVSRMGRDALVVDVAVRDRDPATKVLRLCTTHLESLWEGRERYRPTQLRSIADLLKGASSLGSKIIGGIVGGDMNAIDRAEHELHRTNGIDLKDAWEDVPALEAPQLKRGRKDLTYGRAKGNTWGYQSRNAPRERKRLDKFLYAGSIETVAVEGIGDLSGKIGRIGIGLEVEAMVWERHGERVCKKGKKYVTESVTEILSDRSVERLKEWTGCHDPKLVRGKRKVWASDHFGIVLGIKVL
ncbi:MAG: hypothetical protein LQ348_005293 [Seirophora lacunosa]|nr:MAG: hypothetical protein LQ348_005293 [Seirophora lacunosa]